MYFIVPGHPNLSWPAWNHGITIENPNIVI